tara:strand:+ start:673 stop:909 length:237 start_codon:yes stop_codon:yes gene_type:complete
MNDKTYNGWTNFETWQAALWLDDAGSIEGDDLYKDFLEDYLFFMAGRPETGLAADIFSAWLREVNLTEILEHYAEDTQ